MTHAYRVIPHAQAIILYMFALFLTALAARLGGSDAGQSDGSRYS